MTLVSNAEELALMAQEIGAEVIRDLLKHERADGGWDAAISCDNA